VTWSVTGAGATIDNTMGVDKGVATATAPGAPVIKAALGGVEGTTTLNVSGSSITSIDLTPAMPANTPAGTTLQFTATANLSGGGTLDITDQVTWGVNNPGVGTISNSAPTRGLLSANVPGMVSVTAVFISTGQVSSNSPTVTVTAATLSSISITPMATSVPKGVTVQYTALGLYSDGSSVNITNTVTWGSSTMGVATISNAMGTKGLASTPGVGSTTITATSGGVMSMTTLTVTAAVLQSITVTPANGNLAIAANQQYVATANYSDGPQVVTTQATWASSNAGVATISNAMGSKGLATGVANGSTTITAQFSGLSGMTSLTVP
jgi:hypothetical protein